MRASPGTPVVDRIYRKLVVSPLGCWLFDGALYSNGYGHVRISDGRGGMRDVLTHRIMWEDWFGQIPAGLDLDHLCRTAACFFPPHLEPTTRSVNLKRGVGVGGDRTSAAFRARR